MKFDSHNLPQIINAIFCYYDCDQSDYLKKTEFANVLTRLVRDMGGEKPSLEEIEDIMYELDANGDGQVSKAELTLLMEKVMVVLGDNAMEAKCIGHASRA